ncbi:MAG: hypothetical protein BWY37_01170 [Firmicutes bacterium ADurb.Bin262]|nr:MAG: hypothetical protein BWY37_01170 [Firmicutes bacterium ADurb.Bin262]
MTALQMAASCVLSMETLTTHCAFSSPSCVVTVITARPPMPMVTRPVCVTDATAGLLLDHCRTGKSGVPPLSPVCTAVSCTVPPLMLALTTSGESVRDAVPTRTKATTAVAL